MRTRFSGTDRYVSFADSHCFALSSTGIVLMSFRQHSMLYLPQDHPLMDEKGMDKRLKTKVVTYRKLMLRFGYLIPDHQSISANTKPIDIMNKAFPAFTREIAVALGEPVPALPANNPPPAAAANAANGNGIGGAFSAMTQRIGTAVTGAASAVASAAQSNLPGSR